LKNSKVLKVLKVLNFLGARVREFFKIDAIEAGESNAG